MFADRRTFHPLASLDEEWDSRLFSAGHDVITQIRLVEDG
jgi:hypothetical protein